MSSLFALRRRPQAALASARAAAAATVRSSSSAAAASADAPTFRRSSALQLRPLGARGGAHCLLAARARCMSTAAAAGGSNDAAPAATAAPVLMHAHARAPLQLQQLAEDLPLAVTLAPVSAPAYAPDPALPAYAPLAGLRPLATAVVPFVSVSTAAALAAAAGVDITAPPAPGAAVAGAFTAPLLLHAQPEGPQAHPPAAIVAASEAALTALAAGRALVAESPFAHGRAGAGSSSYHQRREAANAAVLAAGWVGALTATEMHVPTLGAAADAARPNSVAGLFNLVPGSVVTLYGQDTTAKPAAAAGVRVCAVGVAPLPLQGPVSSEHATDLAAALAAQPADAAAAPQTPAIASLAEYLRSVAHAPPALARLRADVEGEADAEVLVTVAVSPAPNVGTAHALAGTLPGGAALSRPKAAALAPALPPLTLNYALRTCDMAAAAAAAGERGALRGVSQLSESAMLAAGNHAASHALYKAAWEPAAGAELARALQPASAAAVVDAVAPRSHSLLPQSLPPVPLSDAMLRDLSLVDDAAAATLGSRSSVIFVDVPAQVFRSPVLAPTTAATATLATVPGELSIPAPPESLLYACAWPSIVRTLFPALSAREDDLFSLAHASARVQRLDGAAVQRHPHEALLGGPEAATPAAPVADAAPADAAKTADANKATGDAEPPRFWSSVAGFVRRFRPSHTPQAAHPYTASPADENAQAAAAGAAQHKAELAARAGVQWPVGESAAELTVDRSRLAVVSGVERAAPLRGGEPSALHDAAKGAQAATGKAVTIGTWLAFPVVRRATGAVEGLLPVAALHNKYVVLRGGAAADSAAPGYTADRYDYGSRAHAPLGDAASAAPGTSVLQLERQTLPPLPPKAVAAAKAASATAAAATPAATATEISLALSIPLGLSSSFAALSGDHNPIHACARAAALTPLSPLMDALRTELAAPRALAAASGGAGAGCGSVSFKSADAQTDVDADDANSGDSAVRLHAVAPVHGVALAGVLTAALRARLTRAGVLLREVSAIRSEFVRPLPEGSAATVIIKHIGVRKPAGAGAGAGAGVGLYEHTLNFTVRGLAMPATAVAPADAAGDAEPELLVSPAPVFLSAAAAATRPSDPLVMKGSVTLVLEAEADPAAVIRALRLPTNTATAVAAAAAAAAAGQPCAITAAGSRAYKGPVSAHPLGFVVFGGQGGVAARSAGLAHPFLSLDEAQDAEAASSAGARVWRRVSSWAERAYGVPLARIALENPGEVTVDLDAAPGVRERWRRLLRLVVGPAAAEDVASGMDVSSVADAHRVPGWLLERLVAVSDPSVSSITLQGPAAPTTPSSSSLRVTAATTRQGLLSHTHVQQLAVWTMELAAWRQTMEERRRAAAARGDTADASLPVPPALLAKLDPGALYAGHSLGEFAAVAALIADVDAEGEDAVDNSSAGTAGAASDPSKQDPLAGGRAASLEAIAELVWLRGWLLQRCVPRDALGRSRVSMSAVFPRKLTCLNALAARNAASSSGTTTPAAGEAGAATDAATTSEPDATEACEAIVAAARGAMSASARYSSVSSYRVDVADTVRARWYETDDPDALVLRLLCETLKIEVSRALALTKETLLLPPRLAEPRVRSDPGLLLTVANINARGGQYMLAGSHLMLEALRGALNALARLRAPPTQDCLVTLTRAAASAAVADARADIARLLVAEQEQEAEAEDEVGGSAKVTMDDVRAPLPPFGLSRNGVKLPCAPRVRAWLCPPRPSRVSLGFGTVDTPFHSPMLAPALGTFRDAAVRVLAGGSILDEPAAGAEPVCLRALAGRYVPNVLGDVVWTPAPADPDMAAPEVVAEAARKLGVPLPVGLRVPARTLLAELLARQLALPVLWGRTQALIAERAEEAAATAPGSAGAATAADSKAGAEFSPEPVLGPMLHRATGLTARFAAQPHERAALVAAEVPNHQQ